LKSDYLEKIEELKQKYLDRFEQASAVFNASFQESTLEEVIKAQDRIMGEFKLLMQDYDVFEESLSSTMKNEILIPGNYNHHLNKIASLLNRIPAVNEINSDLDLNWLNSQIGDLEDSLRTVKLPANAIFNFEQIKQSLEATKEKISQILLQDGKTLLQNLEQRDDSPQDLLVLWSGAQDLLAGLNRSEHASLEALKAKLEPYQARIEKLQEAQIVLRNL